MKITKPYFPSIDGMRAIAILIVLFDHALPHKYPNAGWTRFLIDGDNGVYLFFVISGFLITTLLMYESVNKNEINIRRFYVRRFLRIFPVAYLYILVIIIANCFVDIGITNLTVTGAILYLSNINFFKGDWFFTHFWSLSYEEQFYTWYPFVVKKVKNKLPLFLWNFLLLIVIIRVLLFLAIIKQNFMLQILIGFDGILIGAIGGWYYPKIKALIYKIPYKSIISILLLIFTYIFFNKYMKHRIININSVLASFCLLGFILLNITHSTSIVFRILTHKIMIHIGVLSYSIYIWQQIFTIPLYKEKLNEYGIMFEENTILFLNKYAFPLNFILIYVVSLLSYHLYEKYFLNLKRKFN